MKKKIKVFLQYPWKYTDSSYYKYLLMSPSENIEYITSKNNKGGIIENKRKMILYRNFKNLAKVVMKKLNITLPNFKTVKTEKEYDLIHGAHCLINNKKPWVADMEHVGQFTIPLSEGKKNAEKKVKKILMEKNCKKILAWTKWAKKRILEYYPEIKEKIEVVYPAVPVQKLKKKSSKNINLLFIGRNFNEKGGEIALEVIDNLTKKYDNVHGTIISSVPKKFYEKYSRNKKISIPGLVSHKKLFEEIYPNSDIFIYPTFTDTFGFSILEAQSFGLPVIAMKTQSTHSIEETIQEGKTGFIIDNSGTNGLKREFDNNIIKRFINSAEKPIEDKNLKDKMRKNAINGIKRGKFSIKERNKKLKRIYEGALK